MVAVSWLIICDNSVGESETDKDLEVASRFARVVAGVWTDGEWFPTRPRLEGV